MDARFAWFLVLAVTVGCSNPPITDSSKKLPLDDQPAAKPAPKLPATPATPANVVAVADNAAYEAEIAKHAGKIVVVDFWATWCEPCKERFPHMVELSAQFPKEDVVFVTVSFDEPGKEDKVKQFLTEQRAAEMVNLLSELDMVTSFQEYDIGAIPHYRLYDRDGKLRHKFSNQADAKHNLLVAEELDIKLREMLAAQ